jgi:ribosomal protein L37AE/L43A
MVIEDKVLNDRRIAMVRIATASMKTLSPRMAPFEWNRIIQSHGICPKCGFKNVLRKSDDYWYCIRCDVEYSCDKIGELYPIPREIVK